MPLDRDAIQARSNAAIHHEGETDGYVLAQRWFQSAKDVPALLAEVERQGCVIQDLKVSESRAKALSVKQEIELRLAREVVEAVSKYDEDDRDLSWDRIEIALNRYDDTCDQLAGEAN